MSINRQLNDYKNIKIDFFTYKFYTRHKYFNNLVRNIW